MSFEELKAAVAEAERQVKAAGETPAADAPKGKPVRRKMLPEHFERIPQVIEPKACTCPDCGGPLKTLGTDESEVLEAKTVTFTVTRHIRPKKRCTKCSAIVQAAAPSRPIEKSFAGASLLALVLSWKYAFHHRVLSPGTEKTKRGHMWTYVRDGTGWGSTDPPAVWYQYSPSWHGKYPQKHLARFKGKLQVDGYAGFEPLFLPTSSGTPARVEEVSCMAHARRRFFDIYAALKSPIAKEAVERINALYQIETHIRGHSPEERRAARQQYAVPLLNALHAWMTDTLAGLDSSSKLVEAFNYSLKRWPQLCRYTEDGRLEIDNGAAERSIHGMGIGRRNYLFFGSDSGGERAAIIYSLIESCKLNHIDPQSYLQYVLERIADHPINRVEELLPWNVAGKLGQSSPVTDALAA